MARVFKEGRWIITRSEAGVETVAVEGVIEVSDANDTAAQLFSQSDPWSQVPLNVRQAIGAAWAAYREWLDTRRAAREL